MSNKFKQMQLQMLDNRLAEVSVCDRPSGGWLRTVRTSLGMSVRQLAERIGITQQSAAKLESNEARDAITLRSLRKAAAAMDCRLVYALVPNSSLQDVLRRQACRKAREIVSSVDHSMMLESQSVGDTETAIEQMTDELMNTRVWD